VSVRAAQAGGHGNRRDKARPWLLKGADLVGRTTGRLRVLPDLLICGGQRCGTTSMYKALVQQPTVFRPVWRKGVHYFDVAYDHDLSWYRAHFPLKAQLDLAERRHGVRPIAFESSPYYLFHPRALDRIASDLPEVRVLVLVRDPVERAQSAHAHELARGFETLDFVSALNAEEDRLRGEHERMNRDPNYVSRAHRHQAYRTRGEYVRQLDRLGQLIGRERIKVVDSHRFFAEPETVYEDVLTWLGTTAVRTPQFDQHNARDRSHMPSNVRRELEDHFAPYDARLEPWLGHVPTWRTTQRTSMIDVGTP